jgi:hypothetical protein
MAAAHAHNGPAAALITDHIPATPTITGMVIHRGVAADIWEENSLAATADAMRLKPRLADAAQNAKRLRVSLSNARWVDEMARRIPRNSRALTIDVTCGWLAKFSRQTASSSRR